jgi:hypothetical protein
MSFRRSYCRLNFDQDQYNCEKVCSSIYMKAYGEEYRVCLVSTRVQAYQGVMVDSVTNETYKWA